MASPEIIKPAVQNLIRGSFSIVMDEVRGAYRRKNAPEGGALEISAEEYRELPSLDESRLGDSIAPGGPALGGNEVPDDLFAVVVGMEYEKRILRRSLSASNPEFSHALLIGPPGSAKSLMLEEIRRVPDSRYIVGRNMTSSGLIEMLIDVDEPPRILLIDEIDKSDPSTLATLLTVMDGKATRAIHGKAAVERDVDVLVIAAGNNIANIPAPLRSRFIELEFRDLSTEELENVIDGFLVRSHNLDPQEAREIAKLVASRGGDTRDAAQIAKVRQSDPQLAHEMVERLEQRKGSVAKPRSVRSSAAPEPHQNRTRTAP